MFLTKWNKLLKEDEEHLQTAEPPSSSDISFVFNVLTTPTTPTTTTTTTPTTSTTPTTTTKTTHSKLGKT